MSSSTHSPIAATPRPPYFAVIFTSIRNGAKSEDYSATADRMMALAVNVEGFLGVESVRDHSQLGITVSYWKDLESIKLWKQNGEHLIAQEKGKNDWYSAYTTRICKVERDYSL
jgi:heme-degrading monooxygenase HmoA